MRVIKKKRRVRTSASRGAQSSVATTVEVFTLSSSSPTPVVREFFIDNVLVRIHFIIVMIRWTGLAPWELRGGQSAVATGVHAHLQLSHPCTGVPRS